MRKSWWKLVTIVALTLMGLNFLLFAHQSVAHAAAKPTTPKLTVQDVKKIVAAATPYIHIDKNGVVTIDSSISSHLSKAEVTIVEKYVAQYNNLPSSQKQPHSSGTSVTSKTGVAPNIFGCNQYVYVSHFWWGTRYYLNDCLINTLAAGGIGALIGGIWNLLAPVVSVIDIYVSLLVFSDKNCGNRGAYFDMVFGVPVVNAVC